MLAEEILLALSEIDDSDYAKTHQLRFMESYFFIAPSLNAGMKIMDLGSYGTFGKLIQRFHPEISVEVSDWDLRYYPVYAKHKTPYDMILCMEVLEHMKDQNENGDLELLATYNQSGVTGLMESIKYLLKPDGLLFLTTPNINSWMSLHRLLMYHSPTFYLPHVKEWSIKEIYQLYKKHNLKMLKLETPGNLFGPVATDNQPEIVDLLKNLASVGGYGLANRGDCIFTLAQK